MNKGIVASLGLVVLLTGVVSAQAPPAAKAAPGTAVPKILKPAPGSMNSKAVTLKIEPAAGASTKNFALDWQAKVGGAWVFRDVVDSVALGDQMIPMAAFKGAGEWRFRARAIEGESAPWSEWREFRTPAPVKKAPCSSKAAVGASYDVSATPATMKAGATLTDVAIKVTNRSNRTWGAGSEFRLSYHWVKGGSAVATDGETTPLSRGIRPCGTGLVKATLKAPPAPGTYTLKWDMLREGSYWFSAKGVVTGNREVTVTP